MEERKKETAFLYCKYNKRQTLFCVDFDSLPLGSPCACSAAIVRLLSASKNGIKLKNTLQFIEPTSQRFVFALSLALSVLVFCSLRRSFQKTIWMEAQVKGFFSVCFSRLCLINLQNNFRFDSVCAAPDGIQSTVSRVRECNLGYVQMDGMGSRNNCDRRRHAPSIGERNFRQTSAHRPHCPLIRSLWFRHQSEIET